MVVHLLGGTASLETMEPTGSPVMMRRMLPCLVRSKTTMGSLLSMQSEIAVMDTTAISLCMDNKLPIVVFDLTRHGNIRRIITGEPVGSIVSSDAVPPKR